MTANLPRAVLILVVSISACAADEQTDEISDAPRSTEQSLVDFYRAQQELTQKYESLSPDEKSALGAWLGGVKECDLHALKKYECSYLEFEGGRIYNHDPVTSSSGDPKVMYGEIYQTWLTSGPKWALESAPGLPVTDELSTPDGRGRFNHFRGNGSFSIYWTPEYGAFLVSNWVRRDWSNSGWEQGPWGYPIGPEYDNPWEQGRCGPNELAWQMKTQDFEHGYACSDLDRGWFVPY